MNLRRGDGPPLVIGHRGAAAVAPENTLEALQAAVAAGAQLVEFDIGPDLRLAHSDREVPVGAITLDAALEFLREQSLGVHLDLKQPGYEAEVVETLRRHGMDERALVSTTFSVTTRRLALLAPSLPRAIGYPRDRYGVARVRWPAPLTRLGAAALRQAMPLPRAAAAPHRARRTRSRCTTRSARRPRFGRPTGRAHLCSPGRRTTPRRYAG